MQDLRVLFDHYFYQFFGQPKGQVDPRTGRPRETGGFNLQSRSRRGGMATGAIAGVVTVAVQGDSGTNASTLPRSRQRKRYGGKNDG